MTDKSVFDQSANTVEAALIAALESPERQGAFQTALLTSEIYVVPTNGAPSGDLIFGVDVPFSLLGIRLKAGEEATALFTTVARAKAMFGDDVEVMAMRGQHALEIMGKRWLVMNPGAEQGLVLSPQDSQAILAGMSDARPTRPEDFSVEVAVPDREPAELVDRLRRVLSDPIVTAAWLGRTTHPTTGAKGWRLDVRTEAVFANLKKAVEDAALGLDFHGETLDIFSSLPGGPDGVGIRII